MRFTVSTSSLLDALNALQHVISSKTTLPILSHVLLSADKEELRLVGTDLDRQLEITVPARVETCGEITVHAGLLRSITSATFIHQPEGDMILAVPETGTHCLRVESLHAVYRLPTFPSEEFPFRKAEFEQSADLDPEILAAIRTCAPFMYHDETRYTLQSVNLDLRNGIAKATDGRRLAIVNFHQVGGIDAAILLPSDAVDILQLDLADTFRLVEADKTKARFSSRSGDVRLTCRLIDGSYPNTAEVVPATDKASRVNRAALIHALECLAPLATRNVTGIKLESLSRRLSLTFNNTEEGTAARTEMDCDGDELPSIGMNLPFLLEGLAAFPDETLLIQFEDKNHPNAPIKIQTDRLLYVQMPVRFSN
jgi:DNA polymerase-3 subunit beta